MLDVGQGLAMVIERHGKALLYDTGPAWPQGDSGQQVIIPWLRWHHLQLQGIMLSHEHLDHRGGLDSVLQAWPQAWVRSPLGWAHHLPCHRGERWQWQGLNFRALWPLPGSTAKGNNHSCVVRIDDGRSSILLTGDIERQAEQAMISRYWRHLTSTLIQVPHHGSNTSSSALLVRRVDGAAALASASRYNAWRMPSYKVVQRYRQRGYRWFATPQQGQITVVFPQKGGKSIAYGIKFYRVGIISGLARPPITGRICGYFNTSWFIECRTIKISPRGRPSADFGRLSRRLKPG